jgi:ABC-2 type transport system ATP-binding protein
LLNEPKLLLLDEPTASLDPETSIFIRNYLLEYQKRTSSSILITSHNLKEVQDMCSNIILLKSGEIVSEGNIEEVLKKYNYKTLIELFLSEG